MRNHHPHIQPPRAFRGEKLALCTSGITPSKQTGRHIRRTAVYGNGRFYLHSYLIWRETMKTRHIIVSTIFLALIFAFFVGQAFGSETAVVTPGYEPHEADLFGVRFRSFANTGGGEVYTGLANFGGGPNRAEADLNWTEENIVTFTFDAAADKLIASVTNELGTTTIEYTELTAALEKKGSTYTIDDLNIMQITLANRDQNSLAIFSDVEINGQSVGTFSEAGWNDWMVTGVDFSQGFTVTGKIQLAGAFSNSQEKSKVEIKVGYSASVVPTTTNTPDPTTTNTPEPTATNTPEPIVTIIPGPAITVTPQPTRIPADSTESNSFQLFLPFIIKN